MNLALRVSPQRFLWALRALTVVLAAVMALAIDGASGGRTAAAPVGTVALGVAVAAVIVALVAPSPLGLTVVRLVVPVAVPAAGLLLALGAGAGWGVAALTVALLATLVAFSAETAEAMVQGSAYGDEQRLPLRAPVVLQLPMLLSWAVWCTAALGGTMLLAAGRWVLGAAVSLLAAGLAWLLGYRFHRLSRRWLVVVPAGVVLHDPVVLAETLMMQRNNVAVVRLAPADTEAADLTGPASGHALEVVVHDMELVVLAPTIAEPKGRALHVQSLLVAPSRPGRALRALAAAKVPVG